MSLGITAAGWVAIATTAATVASAENQRDSAEDAAHAQLIASGEAQKEQRGQFDMVRSLLAPYVDAGTQALVQQRALTGLGGDAAQADAIRQLEQSPQFAALLKQGEQGILSNAAATGGLRGGNVQAALAQFRPSLLAQTISDQYSRLGGLVSIGQNAAAGTGNAGMMTGNAISALLQQQGAAQAGAALAGGAANAGMLNGISQGVGLWAGRQGPSGTAPIGTGSNLLGDASLYGEQWTPYGGQF